MGNKTYKYKFSIIMSIYKTDKWLREALDSIIVQDIGFKENIQLILVNDGSPDDSESICLEYRARYPKNIVYVKKENGGLSSARNEGLRHRKGELVNFFDPDDILTPNTLSEVGIFFTTHQDTVDMVAIPLVFFEARQGLHPKYATFGERNRVINLEKEPHNFVLSSASVFYKTELFKSRNFDENILGEEDTIFNFSIFSENQKFGYVCENNVVYWYRRRLDGSSNVNSNEVNPKAYLSPIHLFETIPTKLRKTELYKQLILYELRSRLVGVRQGYFEDKKEYENTIDTYLLYIRKLTLEDIAKSKVIHNPHDRILFATLHSPAANLNLGPKGQLMLSGMDLGWKPGAYLKSVEIDPSGNVVIDVLSHDFGKSNQRLVLSDKEGKLIKAVWVKSTETPQSIKRGEFLLSKTQHYRFVLSSKHSVELRFVVKEGKKIVVSNVKVRKFKMSKFALDTKRVRDYHEGFYISAYGNVFKIQRTSVRLQQLSNVIMAFFVAKNGGGIRLRRLLSVGKKRFLVLADRPMIAGDNAEALFQYIQDHEPQLKRYTYYVLDKKSEDYKRLHKTGRVVAKGSLKHWYVFINAKLLICSHLANNFVAPFKQDDYKWYGDLLCHRYIWVQHGITYNDVSTAATKFHKGIKAVTIATTHELKEFIKPSYGYDHEDILETGFTRFDRLKDTSKRSKKRVITVMPTWRSYISNEILDSGLHKRVEGFRDTDYYQRFRSLLTDARLQRKLADKNIELQFVLHPGVMSHVNDFKVFENSHIKVLEPGDVVYKKIFSRTSLLITDYSSVFFDFAYLYKPVLFYQFDKDKFFTKHYKASDSFTYEKNAPGKIVYDHEKLIKEVLEYIQSEFTLQSTYRRRIDKLFIHHDLNNSKRLVASLRDKEYL
jgi:CDP-glycerol glycerophosphotransferase (TagB/SpsB family)/glycosyltransferase involved in cell wall biosynthesis